MINYSRIISDEAQALLEYDLLDVKDWIDKAIDGKIANCKKRAAIQYREILKAEGAEMLPANDDTAAKALFDRSDYKNRTQRDAE